MCADSSIRPSLALLSEQEKVELLRQLMASCSAEMKTQMMAPFFECFPAGAVDVPSLVEARPALPRSWANFQVSLPDSNEPLCMLNHQRELTLPRLTAAPTATSSAYLLTLPFLWRQAVDAKYHAKLLQVLLVQCGHAAHQILLNFSCASAKSRTLLEKEMVGLLKEAKSKGVNNLKMLKQSARPALPRSWAYFQAPSTDSNEPSCMLKHQRELTLPRPTAAPTATSSAYLLTLPFLWHRA